MNTDDNLQDQSSNNLQTQSYNALENSEGIEQQPEETISSVVESMQSVDTESAEAKQNATSMDDGKGGRIEFNEEDKEGIFIRGIDNL